MDEERLIVAVEWFENGETKGKEVSKYPTVYTVLVSRNIVGLYLELSWLEVANCVLINNILISV